MKTRLSMLVTTTFISLASGCTPITLKPPASVATALELKVEGHSDVKTFREKDLKIGSYVVHNIDRDWNRSTSLAAGPWSRESGNKAYRFDLKAQSRTLHGECTEAVAKNGIAGFGTSSVTFGCTCKEGESQRVKLDLVNGSGTALLAASTQYTVNELHESEQGAYIASPLGYHFQTVGAEGVVDVSGKGRAWVPASASEHDQFGLVCAYAALLLYRPTEM